MNEDVSIFEIMLELAEEENKDLKEANEYLDALVTVLKKENKDLIMQYNALIDINKRLN